MLVSVVMPVYNAEKFLDKSIESVINQTYNEIELILVDDGSTDSSKTICDKYALADKRIKVISQKNNGPAAARNAGTRSARGDFVFFLDADDYIDKNTLEILVTKYDQYQPDLVMANFNKLENSGEIIKQRVSFNSDNKPFDGQIKELSKADIGDYIRHFLKHPSNHLISYCWARLYKLSIIKNNGISANEDMRLFEDFVYNLDYLKHTNNIVFVNEALYTYTMHNAHVSASMAIINADSLLHDMNVFKLKANDYFKRANAAKMVEYDINKEIGHALVHYAIIFITRSCRLVTRDNRKRIYNEIHKIINAPIFRDALQNYSPSKGNSRIFPLLARFKLVELIIMYCRYKAYKRYGRMKSN